MPYFESAHIRDIKRRTFFHVKGDARLRSVGSAGAYDGRLIYVLLQILCHQFRISKHIDSHQAAQSLRSAVSL